MAFRQPRIERLTCVAEPPWDSMQSIETINLAWSLYHATHRFFFGPCRPAQLADRLLGITRLLLPPFIPTQPLLSFVPGT